MVTKTWKWKDPVILSGLTIEELCEKLILVNAELENLRINTGISEHRKLVIEKRIKERLHPKPVLQDNTSVPWDL